MLRFVQRCTDRTYFERPENMPRMLHRLLIQRGISSLQEAEAFLHPSIDQLNDPFRLNDMAEAVEAIRSVLKNNSRICIYGDYDVDGVCASSILYLYFHEIGADVQVYIPSRHEEGYGLNESAVRQIAAECDMLISVDCGIASLDLIALAKQLGLACVVTDHHRPGEALPPCPTVNPLLNGYPCPCLCGAGTAFKLVQALGGLDAAMEYIDLAAIATVADVVSLTGENRAIVHLGLERINRNPRPGVLALMESARLQQGQVDSEAIGFRIAPRLNAGGRLGSARRSFDLLVEEDEFSAVALADALEQENIRRQTIEKEIRAGAMLQLQDYDFSAHRIIMVHGEGWNSGVIGLTASHLKEQFHCPVIALAENEGMLTGSCRSIPGVDIYKTLSSAAHLMEKFGGHSQAAGLTVKKENLAALQEALDDYLFKNIPAETYVPFAEYDTLAELDLCDEAFVQSLAALEPTGCGNPRPVFRAEAYLMDIRAMGAQNAHLRMTASQNGTRRTAVFFGHGHLAETLGENAEILFTPQLNTWNGRTDVQLMISALREIDPEAQIMAAKSSEARFLRKFLTELIYNKGYQSLTSDHLTLRELKQRMDVHAQGTMVLCADTDSALAVARYLSPIEPDILIGRMCDDPRMYNSLCVCPDRLDFPPALRMLVLADVPVPKGLNENVQVYALEGIESAVWHDLPDVNQMREVYKAALRLSQRPLRTPDADALNYALSVESGQSVTAVHASLLALQDMKLVALRERPFGLAILPKHKTNPDDSSVWRAVRDIKLNAEGRTEHDRQS